MVCCLFLAVKLKYGREEGQSQAVFVWIQNGMKSSGNFIISNNKPLLKGSSLTNIHFNIGSKNFIIEMKVCVADALLHLKTN